MPSFPSLPFSLSPSLLPSIPLFLLPHFLGETYVANVSMCVVCKSVRYMYVWDIITCIVHHLFADLLGTEMTTLKVQQNKTKLHRALHGEVMHH